MEKNPYAINVESNPYQIELAGHEHGQVHDDGKHDNEYAPSNNMSNSESSNRLAAYRAKMPTRASISRQGKALVKGVQDRGGCRLAICLLGVTLCWLSSFQVANSFVEILFTPANGGPKVQESWEQFGSQVNLERVRNIGCVNASLDTCVGILETDFAVMTFEVDVLALQNDYLVQNATKLQQRCADDQKRIIESIQVYKLALSNASKAILWNNVSCSENEKVNLNSLYTNPTLTSNQATTATTQYGNSNEVTWAQAYESMQRRAAYDSEYWANKTAKVKEWYINQNLNIDPPNLPNFTADFDGFNADLSEYWACATLSSTPPCPHAGGLRASADATAAAFRAKYSALNATAAQQKAASQAYLNQAQAKIQGYENYASSVTSQLNDLRNKLAAIQGACGPTPSACDALTASFPNPLQTDIPDALDLSGITIGAMPNINFDSLMAGLSFNNATADVRAQLAAMQTSMNGLSAGWTSQIGFNIDNQFDWNASFGVDFGYNPPPVNVDTGNVSNLTNWYVSKTTEQLSGVAAKLTPGNNSGGGNKTEEFLRNLQLGANSISSTDYTFASLVGGFDLDLWFFSVDWFRFFLYFLDYAWRIWYSGRIFIRYWFGAAGTMPPIDIRSYRTTKATPLNVRIARYATHPFVLFGGAMIVAIMVVSVIVGLYIPMLHDYIQGCVKADALGKSTFLSGNVYAAAFNAAVLQGNRDLAEGLGDYDTARANLCGTKQQNARDAFANQQYQLKIVRDNMKSVANLLDQMERCTSSNTWTQLPNPFLTYTNAPEPSHVAGCSMADFDALGYLEPPPINCTNLPTCGTGEQCAVDVSVISGVSHRASCQTEWYIHSTILKAVCTIVVFIFWNVCRSLLLDGLVRVYWQHLVRGTGLNFYSTCNQKGQIDTDTEDQLAVAIKQSDASYKRMGILYIVMSFLLNIPYIVFCILLNVDIAYPY